MKSGCSLSTAVIVICLVGSSSGNLPAAEGLFDPKAPRPVAAKVDGFRVFAYGQFNIYEVSPTYDDHIILQANNSHSWSKIIPKKSWEIASNRLGLTPTRSPSGYAPELEPTAPVYFIDGNPGSRGLAGKPWGDPSTSPAWIKIDLPRPTKINAIGFVNGGASNVEVRVSQWDLWQRRNGGPSANWLTVYRLEGNQSKPPAVPQNTAPNVFQPEQKSQDDGSTLTVHRFDPVEAREIWVTSPERIEAGELQVYDTKDSNVALLSKGASVKVSKSAHLFWLDEETQSSLWHMNYDLGMKWLRLSYYLSPLIWPYVERTKGEYQVDPYLDALVTQASQHGVEVALTLGPPQHPLYADKAAAIEGFRNYARFMAGHFKDRVRYFEILNEFYNQDSWGPNKQGPVEREVGEYLRIALPAAEAIREAAPNARIIACGPCPLVADFILGVLKGGMVKYADVISWHPYSFPQDTDDDYAPEELDRPRHVWAPPEVKTYADAVNYLRKESQKLGFQGELWANEVGAYAIHNNRTSNLIAAKYLARSAVLHSWLDVPMFWNETTSLLRPAWQPFWDEVPPDLSPDYSYYVFRTLATLLDGAKPSDVVAKPTAPIERFQSLGFTLPGGDQLLAVWIAEKSRKHQYNEYPHVNSDVTIPCAAPPKRVMGIDLLNGRQREMISKHHNGQLTVAGLQIGDYPLLLRLER